MPIYEDLAARRNIPTLPLDLNDPFRFSQLVETSKDCIQRELTLFLTQTQQDYPDRLAEIPTIEKYNVGSGGSESPIETITRILLQHPDVLEKLPLISVTGSTGQTKKLGLGTQLVDQWQPPARIKGTNPGPYSFVSGDKVAFLTWPDGQTQVQSTVIFLPQMVQSLASVTLAEVVAICNVQMLYASAQATSYSTVVPLPRFNACGPATKKNYPNRIQVLGTPFSTANALAQLGLTAGQLDDSKVRNPCNRYNISSDLTINLDIGCEDENQRRELTDLVNYFFSLEMDKRKFEFYGRTVFDDEFVPAELFQVILLDRHSLAGEAEIPRGSGGEKRDFIYINRFSVPITIVDYVDREINTAPRRLDEALLSRNRVDSDGLPAGDHSTAGDTSG